MNEQVDQISSSIELPQECHQEQIQQLNSNECHEISEIDQGLENLELLCNQVEAVQFKEDQKKEIEVMKRNIDLKLAKIKHEKQKAKEQILVNSLQNMKEKYSGLIMKQRLLNEDDVDIYTSAREFIPIETLDQTVTFNSQALKAFFTIGVIVESSGAVVMTTKTGKAFSVFKISDLIKYDITMVKKILAEGNQDNQEHLALSEKSFNSNGYKTLKVMAFSDAATAVSKMAIGTVVGLLNPKPMKSSTPDQGITFCIDIDTQIFKIGFSEELAFCKGVPKQFAQMNALPFVSTGLNYQCRHYMNKSIEEICDQHKFMLQEQKLARIRSNRVGLHTDYLDLNKIRKQQELEDIQNKIGAWGGGKGRFKQGPYMAKPQLSPQARHKLDLQRKKEEDTYNNFMKERGSRADNGQKKNFISALNCKETQHLKQVWQPGMLKDQPQQLDFKNDQKLSNPTIEEDDTGIEIEIDIGDDRESSDVKNFSFRSFLQNRKMKHEERFLPDSTPTANDELKRRKIE